MVATMTKYAMLRVRATQEEMDRWFEAAELLVATEGDANLSRHARRMLNAWAAEVLASHGKRAKGRQP